MVRPNRFLRYLLEVKAGLAARCVNRPERRSIARVGSFSAPAGLPTIAAHRIAGSCCVAFGIDAELFA